MAEHSRYQVSAEATGVRQGVLQNKLGLKTNKELDDAETLLLADTYQHYFELLRLGKVKFDLDLIFSIHKYFLGTLYSWAGKVRTVNISKNEMFFAPVEFIDNSLTDFDSLLRKQLADTQAVKKVFANTLATIHNEFNVIHPFREGNGRTIRMFLDLVASNFGYDPIDWSKRSTALYLKACIEGAKGNHEPMAKLILQGLKKSK